MVRVLVEKIFEPPITQEKWNHDLEIGIPCHRAHNVHWIRSMMARDRTKVICEFEAPDAETVRKSFRKAGLPFARIWTIDILEPDVLSNPANCLHSEETINDVIAFTNVPGSTGLGTCC